MKNSSFPKIHLVLLALGSLPLGAASTEATAAPQNDAAKAARSAASASLNDAKSRYTGRDPFGGHRAMLNRTILPYSPRDVRTRVTGDFNFGVSDRGSATVHIPLWVPPGRAGVQPTLSLQYDSAQDNGLLGNGWTLDGVSRIARCMKNGYDDPLEVRPLTWDESDALCLDGERLVLVQGIAGASGAVYRTRHDQFSQVTVVGYDDLGPVSFEVRLKDHRILFYGQDSSSRTEGTVTSARGQDSPTEPALIQRQGRLEWLLSRIEDRSGNFALYKYSGALDPQALEPLLQEIAYTGSSSNPATHRHVSFSYEARPDITEKYLAGMRLSRNLRLAALEMYAPRPDTPVLARKYLLDYETAPITGRSRLEAVRECDSDPASESTSVAPLCRVANFQYQDASASFDDFDTGITDSKFQWVDEKLVPPRLAVGDFNGDGRDDILYTTANQGRRLRLSTGTVFGEERSAINETGLLDYDADSRTDVLELNYPESKVYRSVPDMMGGVLQSPLVSVPGGAFVKHYTDLGLTVHNLTQWSLVEAADLDGDRRPDLVVHMGRWPWYYESDFTRDPVGDWGVIWNSGTSNFLAPQQLPIQLRPDHRFIDTDGDGRAEILTRIGSRNLLMALSVSGRNNVGAFQTALPGQTNYVFLDSNADGLSDVLVDPGPPALGILPDNIVQRFWLSLGNGFVPKPLSLSGPMPAGDLLSPYARKRVIDYYLNGRQQLLVSTHTNGPENSIAVVGINADGSAHAQILPFSAKNASSYDPFEVMDANGDGLDDILLTVNDRLHLFVRKGKKPDLLVAASGTLGTDIQFRYRPLSPQDETSRSDCSYPVGCVYSKLWVVDQLRVDTGLGDGSYRIYNHSFEDGRSDLLGLGFLGFKTHTVEEPALQHTVSTTFDLSPGSDYRYPGAGHPVRIVDVTITGAGVQHRRTMTFENAVKITDDSIAAPHYPFFVYQKSSSSVEREISGASNSLVSHVTRSVDVDAYGNTTKVVEEWPEASLKQEVTISYRVRPDVWLVDLPHLSTTRGTDSLGSSVTRRSGFEYDDKGLLQRLIREPGAQKAAGFRALPPQQDGVRTLSTTLNYTAEGLPELISQTDMATGETRTESVAYDPVESMFPVTTLDSLNHAVELVTEPSLGVLAMRTDANGVSTQYQYDGFGRLRFVHAPDGSNSQLSYAAPLSGPHLLEITERTAGHGRRIVVLDSLKRVVLERTDIRQDGKFVNAWTWYDSAGRIAGMSRRHFDSVVMPPSASLKYDNLGRLLLLTLPDGSSMRATYEGRVINYLDAAGNQSLVVSDTAGRTVRSTQFESLVSATLPNPPSIGLIFSYAPFNVLSAVEGANGYRYEVHADRLGRPIVSIDPDAGTAGSKYNAFGDLIEVTRGGTWKAGADVVGGEKTTFDYDPVGRPVEVNSPDGITQYTWDIAANGIGMLAKTHSPDNIETQYAYDSLARLATKFAIVDGQKYALTQHYDSFGRVSALTYPDVSGLPAITVQTLYSSGGEPISVQRAGGGPVYWKLKEIDAAGEFGSIELGNGVQTQVTGLPNGVLTRIFSKGPKGPVQDLAYKFHEGRMVGRRDDIANSTETFEYDGLDRLTRWLWQKPAASREIRWNFKHGAQLRQRSVEQGPGNTLNYDYDKAVAGPHAVVGTELGTYQYDTIGRQVSGPGRIIEYASFDLPKSITTASAQSTFAYDAFQRRIMRRSNSGSSVLSIDRLYDVQTSATDRKHSFHIYAGDKPVADFIVTQKSGVPTSQDIRYLHADHNGSITTLTDGSANVVSQGTYEPFGARVSTADAFTAVAAAPHGVSSGFTGQRHESDSDLVDFVGRLYDPNIGRFLTPDPVLANPLNALGYDPYSYLGDNPVVGRDPTGFEGAGVPIDADISLSSSELPEPATSDLDSTPMTSGCVQPPFCSTVRGTWSGPSTNAGGDTGDLGAFSSQPFSSAGAPPPPPGFGMGGANVSDNRSCGTSPMVMCKQPFYVDPAFAGVARDAEQGHLRAEDPLSWLIPVSVSARAAGAGSRWLWNATVGSTDRFVARGAGRLGGRFLSTTNTAGGTIWTSTGNTAQNFFARIVKRAVARGESVTILTGTHGHPIGLFSGAELSFLRADARTFGHLPGVNVLDITEMTASQITKVLEGAGTVVGGFCHSGACLARFAAFLK